MGTATSTQVFLGKYLFGKYLLNPKHRHAKRYVAWNLHFLKYSLLCSIVLAVVAFIIMHSLHFLGYRVIDDYHLSVYMLWVVPIAALCFLLSSYLLANRHVVISFLFKGFVNNLWLLIFFCVVFYFLEADITENWLVALVLAAFFLTLLIELVLLKITMPFLYQIEVFKKTGLSWFEKHWMSSSLRLIVNNVLLSFVCALDIIIIAVIRSEDNSVGYYAAASIIALMIWVIPQGIYQLLKIDVSALLLTKKGRDQIQKRVNRTNYVALTIAFALFLLFILEPNTLLAHFGNAYLTAKPTLFVLCMMSLMGLLGEAAIVLMIYSHNEKKLLNITIVELFILLIFGSMAAYFYGNVGMAFVTLFAVSLKSIYCIYFVRHEFHIRPVLVI